MITPTTITSEDQIHLTGSPITLRIRNYAQDNTIKSVYLELYIWKGNLNAPSVSPKHILKSEKASFDNDYVAFQISELLAAEINNTRFAFTAGDQLPTIAGEGIFWQTKHIVTNNDGIAETEYESLTNFATRGFRYDFEQVGTVLDNQPYNGLIPINYERNYTDKIKYFRRSFDFTKGLEECTSENIILSTNYTPTEIKCQLGDTYLVVYLNRLGLFDYFTPYGRSVKSIELESTTNPRLFRNINSINNNVNHSANRSISQSSQKIEINSGSLKEDMTEQIEEVILSPLVYLVEFTGETFIITNVGLTVDNTIVTADSTIYTADNQTVTTQDLGFFSSFKQIPVTCSNQNFTKKTRRNDKQKINYDLTFAVTTDRINNLR